MAPELSRSAHLDLHAVLGVLVRMHERRFMLEIGRPEDEDANPAAPEDPECVGPRTKRHVASRVGLRAPMAPTRTDDD